MRKTAISFQTKPWKLFESDNSFVMAFDYKRKLTRRDCNLKPYQHPFYNSDLFESMLNRAYQVALNGRTWDRVDAPKVPGVRIKEGFLITVSLEIEL